MNIYLKRFLTIILISILGLTVVSKIHSKPLKSAFVSVSARTPKQEDIKVFDYEFKAGIESSLGNIWTKFERENNILYRGLSIKTAVSKVKTPKYDLFKLADGWSGELLIDETRPTNELYIYKKLAGWDIISVRMSNLWDEWLYQGVLLGVKLNIDYNGIEIKASYDTDALDNHIGKVKLSHKYNLGKFYIQPFIVYENRNALIFWQAKTEVGFLF